jgi:organic radical activating enzyme
MNNLSFEMQNEIVTQKYGEKFCAAPFTSLHEGEGGLISTCCKTRNPLGYSSENSLEEIMNSDEAKKVRKLFLERKTPDQCQACWKMEESGKISSNRAFSNRSAFQSIDDIIKNTAPDGTLLQQKPVWVDLLWTNKCNFACLGCKPELSSTIASKYINEFSTLHGIDYTTSTTSWNNDNSKKIEYILKHKDSIEFIHLNGGEPFLAEDIHSFLETLIEHGLHKKIVIWSHTNGSIKKYKGKDIVLDYLAKWEDRCRITMSIDGHGKYGEYIRYGYNDKKWLETYKKVKNSNISVSLQFCLNVFNVFYVNDFIDWLHENNINDHVNLTMWYTTNLNLRLLNHVPELKREAIVQLKKTLERKDLPLNWNQTMTTHIKWFEASDHADHWNLSSFYKGIEAIDAKRGTNFLETFPMLEPLYLTGKSLI